eukprot:TRINITY_DN19226_c0_g1_i5.p1 TRINITY_DN19226_c0_g1~~TRINITY_DN19226_c0_g1_i5.p1  ORF type:complete len:183 (-),score=14.74 TRINITY_DN19226_c0_g1_i5:41-589(-)
MCSVKYFNRPWRYCRSMRNYFSLYSLLLGNLSQVLKGSESIVRGRKSRQLAQQQKLSVTESGFVALHRENPPLEAEAEVVVLYKEDAAALGEKCSRLDLHLDCSGLCERLVLGVEDGALCIAGHGYESRATSTVRISRTSSACLSTLVMECQPTTPQITAHAATQTSPTPCRRQRARTARPR